MATINDNYLKLKAGYLFPEIGRRVNAFAQANPDAKIIRLGIGDVTEPLPEACRTAMIKAVDDMGDRTSFKGYAQSKAMPGYERKLQPLISTRGVARWMRLKSLSPMAQSATQAIFSTSLVTITPLPSLTCLSVYVDTNVLAGHTGEANDKGEFEGLVYLPITPRTTSR
jgi:LL-diaminopimelate aminotransferase